MYDDTGLYAKNISIGDVDRQRIIEGLRSVTHISNEVRLDATLSFDATYLVKRVKIVGETKILGVS